MAALEIGSGPVRLRDFMLVDLPARLRWETEETEWQRWDAPWEYVGKRPDMRAEAMAEFRSRLHALARHNLELDPDAQRLGFEIYRMEPRENIGWVNAYWLGDDLDTSAQASGRLAVGLAIPRPELRRQGYGMAALTLFCRYLFGHGHKELYLQTWSGNRAIVLLAAKMGFEPYHRKPDLRQVDGQSYDGLTFRLEPAGLRGPDA